MNPTPLSGLSVIVSILVLIIAAIGRLLRIPRLHRFHLPVSVRLVCSVVIALGVGAFALFLVTPIITTAPTVQRMDGSLALLTPTPVCAERALEATDHVVIFRLDDVSANFHSAVSMRILKDAEAKGIPMVASVIPKQLGNDRTLLAYLRSARCFDELALHGWDHVPETQNNVTLGEFGYLGRRQAQHRLDLGLQIFSSLTNTIPTTFVPPRGDLSVPARITVEANGFTVVSGKETGFYDLDADIWDYETQAFGGAENAVADCERSFAMGDPICTIVIHPQDFIDEHHEFSPERYREMEKLLTYFANDRFTTTTFRDYTTTLEAKAGS